MNYEEHKKLVEDLYFRLHVELNSLDVRFGSEHPEEVALTFERIVNGLESLHVMNLLCRGMEYTEVCAMRETMRDKLREERNESHISMN